MKVKSDGTFSYKLNKSLMGGPLLTEQVHGKFVTATKATGSASYGRCHEKFTANSAAPPPPTTSTETATSQPTDTTSPY